MKETLSNEEDPLISSMSYTGGSNNRTALVDGVLDAGTEPHYLHIPEHSEMAYLDRFPSLISFACVLPATVSGGSTTVVESAAVEGRLPAPMRAKLRTLGIEHVMYYGSEGVKTWQLAFSTSRPQDVEEYARVRGWALRWTPKKTGVYLSYRRASFLQHPRTRGIVLSQTDRESRASEPIP